ncbi:hypothetical protein LPJ53_003502 [Coemansia erecta]|uniref:Carboxymuconolactone decarboxylase-like domain-containing protein n=1 Tax=Coemansia erecta TaxID=147472 RepID=A0A9W8CQR9_9FUNG|nr:hypothetical protein LPJ53_003502 [Coemansia erecta]
MDNESKTLSPDEIDSWSMEAQPLSGNLPSLVAISTLASANRPVDVASIARRRIQQLATTSEQVQFIQQTRESILKMSSITGTPRSINALTSLMSTVEPGSSVLAELLNIVSPRSESSYDYAQIRARGEQLFASIYGRHAETVEAKLHSLYPDLAEVIISDSYGRLLSETRYLGACETELCAIGSLVPQDVPAQLKSHCIGAKRLEAEVPSCFDYIQLDSVGQALRPELRYTVAVTAMASANKPSLISPLVCHCVASLSDAEFYKFVTTARESLLKMVATVGAPRIINATAALMDAVPEEVASTLPRHSNRSKSEYNYDAIRSRGEDLWRSVYSRQAEKLEQKIGNWYPDLIEVIKTDLYGRLLSNCTILGACETELCTIAALSPIDVPAQLKSHVLGAGRLGVSQDEISAAIAIADMVVRL